MSIEEQRNRLKNALNYLKQKGYLQKDIAAGIGTDNIYISHLKSGRVKKIPDSFLIGLQEKYGINPDYIRGESKIMFDVRGTNLDHFEKAVDSWSTVKHSENQYLHISMDSNFYNFLIDIDTAKIAADQGVSSVQTEIKMLKQLHNSNPDIQEYVLIPRNNFIKLVADAKKQRKELTEVLDLAAFTDYLDE